MESLKHNKDISVRNLNHLDINSVICFEATKIATKVYFDNDKKEYISVSVNEIDKMICTKNFIRVHHSYLVNSKKILKFTNGDGGYLDMGIGFDVPVSRHKKINLILYFKELSTI